MSNLTFVGRLVKDGNLVLLLAAIICFVIQGVQTVLNHQGVLVDDGKTGRTTTRNV